MISFKTKTQDKILKESLQIKNDLMNQQWITILASNPSCLKYCQNKNL